MVFVDVQVTLAAQAQVEARVGAELFQHVVEKAEPGFNIRLRRCIQVDLHDDVGFVGLALHARGARRIHQRMGDGRPFDALAEQRAAQLETADAQVGGELHIGVAVANHRAARPVDGAILEQVRQQSDIRLPRG